MALSLVITIGGKDSNSYASVAEANAYFEGRFPAGEGWGAFNATQKMARLIYAAKLIDTLPYIGKPTNVAYDGTDTGYYQALQWPRKDKNVSDMFATARLVVRDQFIEVDEIPQAIKNAQFEIALSIFDSKGNVSRKGNVMADGTVIRSETLGNWSVQYGDLDVSNLDLISFEAFNFLLPYIDDSQISLSRA